MNATSARPAVLALIDLVTGERRGDSLGTLYVAAPFVMMVVLALTVGLRHSRMADLLDALRPPRARRDARGDPHRPMTT
ncbi:hypothetical protein [Nonomuraea sp. NPDC049709]|uniref:hypothetical protein n=1 Tax=Nonomuraea sp. NPDC049709 TaxID=3154736 RepID=UPI0034248FC2